MAVLPQRFTRLPTTVAQLSLDESPITAFGRVKFKVGIISKAERYGKKIYVLAGSK